MKIVIAGGTGFIGKFLYDRFIKEGNDVVVISRKKPNITWDLNEILNAIEGAHVLINLAGKSINCRHNFKNRNLILKSRIETTRLLNQALELCQNPPDVFINSSATAIYKCEPGEYSTEKKFTKSNTFLSEVIQKWENEFFTETKHYNIRKVALRTSVVLGKDGGAFQKLYLLSKIGLGGKSGTGQQIFSWIHLHDYYKVVQFVVMNPNLIGVVNCTSTQPVSNAVLMKTIRKIVNVNIGIPAPAFGVKIGSFLLKTEPSLILESSCVYPEKLLNEGFSFEFQTIEKAVNQLVNE